MNINIAGRHMETGDSLQSHIEEKMANLKKYFEHVIDIDISLQEESNSSKAEVTVHANGIHLRAIGQGGNFYQAIDDAENKLSRQLKKYKGRMTKHIRRRQHNESKLDVMAQLSFAENTMDEAKMDELPDEWLEDYAPIIKHKAVSKVAPMSVDDAIMQMDLLHKPAFLFQNAQTGTLNVVYRESDGSVKWISPA